MGNTFSRSQPLLMHSETPASARGLSEHVSVVRGDSAPSLKAQPGGGNAAHPANMLLLEGNTQC